MQIIYPYNEILPKRAAHDVYLFNECAALASEGNEVMLLIGNGSSADHALEKHYQMKIDTHLAITRLPIIRKNFFPKISWNFPFFFSCERVIKKKKPDWVFLSVLKQADYHLKRKNPKTRYLYEVHQLLGYPTFSVSEKEVEWERKILSQADMITTTTEALRQILLEPPYSLKIPIFVIPLAVKADPLPPPPHTLPITIAYVGQLYAGQGISTLLVAMAQAPHTHLKIIGGKPDEVQALQQKIDMMGLAERVECLGFHPPSDLPPLLSKVHAFVAPFEPIGRMPYVAHTKLYEYAEWGRPLIVPDMPIVREHFQEGQGVHFFKEGDSASLANALNYLSTLEPLLHLYSQMPPLFGRFSWQKRARQILSKLY